MPYTFMAPSAPPPVQPMVWKNIPPPVRLCLRPWLWLALALHGVFLLLPMPSDPPPVIEVPEDESVSLTPLPTTTRLSQPSPSPQVRASPTPTPSPVVRPSPSPAIAPPPVQQPAAIAPPPSTPAASPNPTPAPPPPPSPDTTASPPPEATLLPPVPPVPDPDVPETAWANFPHPEGSTTCDEVENCWVSPESRWRSLVESFEQTLQAQGYTLNDVTEQYLSTITGRRIYAVEKDGETQYFLNVISTLQGTRYINSDEPLSESELDQLAGV